MRPSEYGSDNNTKEVENVISGENPPRSARSRNIIPGGLLPLRDVDAIEPPNVHKPEDDNNSKYPDVKQTLSVLGDRPLTNLTDQYQPTNPSPDTENMPNPSRSEQLSRRIERIRHALGFGPGPTPREKVDREIKKIIDCGSTLRNWAQQNLEGKGPEIGPERKTDQISTFQWLVAYASYKRPLALESSDGGSKLGTDEINRLRLLAVHPYHKYLFGSKLSDEDTKLGDTKSRDAALTQLTKIAQELQAWDQYRLRQKDQPFTIHELERREQQEVARREKIERLLQDLPENRPSVLDLPKKQRWQLYIDKADHENAKEQNPSNPGALYNDHAGEFETQPRFQESMEYLFEVLAKKKEQNLMNTEMDYEIYTQLHECATMYVPQRPRDLLMRQPNGLDRGTRNYGGHSLQLQASREARLEQFVALKEMSGERYNDLALFQYWPTDVEQIPRFEITLKRAKALPQGIVIGQEGIPDSSGSPDPNEIDISPLYSKEAGPKLIDAILKSYYMGRKVPNQTPFDRLREIARHIRAVHTMHQKRDGNGRTNLRGLLNMWLEEEGFSPIISPVKPQAFRGDRTLDGLVEDILTGMHDFINVVNECKLQEPEPNPEATFQRMTGGCTPQEAEKARQRLLGAFRNP